VNAGTGTVTIFAVGGDELRRTQIVASGGKFLVPVNGRAIRRRDTRHPHHNHSLRRLAEKVRRAEVRLLRTLPELFVAPDSGSRVMRATGEHRARGLFEDEMTARLPIGLDLTGQPVYADMRFVDGRVGGHVSISGVSGVATKTSYALFLLYQLLETDTGIDLLGGLARRAATRALVFNTKGEDLLHIDRANRLFPDKPDAGDGWRRLGVEDPGPFTSVRLCHVLATGGWRRVTNMLSRAVVCPANCVRFWEWIGSGDSSPAAVRCGQAA
jgi:hypothetical protein